MHWQRCSKKTIRTLTATHSETLAVGLCAQDSGLKMSDNIAAMTRTYEVVRIKPQYGTYYYSPCLVLNGQPTTWHGRMHQYPRTARQALAKWAAAREADLANAYMRDIPQQDNQSDSPMWEYCYTYRVSTTFHHRADVSEKIRKTTVRCQFDDRAEIVTLITERHSK